MIDITDSIAISEDELVFAASRSRGPGGQHVNTSSTRVTLRFDVSHSPNLTAEQKARILETLASRVTKDGVLLVSAQKHRSQIANRELAQERLIELLRGALRRPQPRKPTRVPEVERERRLEEKRRRAQTKRDRSQRDLWEE
jgi:ribosome-associated protein